MNEYIDEQSQRSSSRCQPEEADIGEIVLSHIIHHHLPSFYQITADDILHTGGSLRGPADDSGGSSCRLCGRDIHRHQSAQETDEHTYTQAEQHDYYTIEPIVAC